MSIKDTVRVNQPWGVSNQLRIETNDAIYFQSYDSIIARIQGGEVTLDKKFWNFSTTTSKYRNKFLGETTAETQKKIDAGVYVLDDLN